MLENKTQKLLLILCCVIATISLHAQEKLPRAAPEVGISIGYNSGWLKDLNFSPIHYTQGGLLYSFDYRKVKNSNGNSLLVHLDFSSGGINTPVGDYLRSDMILGNASVTWLKKTQLLNSEKLNLSLGGGYHFFIQYLDFNGQSAFSFFGNHSLGISGQLDYHLSEKANLHFGLEIPVVNLIVRPPYNGNSFELEQAGAIKRITDGHLGSFNNLIAWDFQLRYARQLSNRTKLNITYLNRFHYLNDDDLLRQMQNQISVGLAFQL